MAKTIDVEAFKKEGFSFEEIESVKRWLDDIEKGRTISYEEVKIKSRKKLFSKQKIYA
jgi:predicted transcriptional regulator